MKKIILASASPRRQQLLRQIGLEFQVMASEVEEDINAEVTPADLVEELARKKARSIATKVVNELVIGADTVVVNDGTVMGKPINSMQAAEMLGVLNGKSHQVITGVAVIDKESGAEVVFHETTQVNFKKLSSDEIENYIASGEPLDKAGAYAIQGLGAVLVEGIVGCYFNVVGLPLSRLVDELQKFGIKVL